MIIWQGDLLEIPTVVSPETAVKMAIVTEAKGKKPPTI
jgi:hypothetical protein